MYIELKTKRLIIRSWRFGDEKELQTVANNKKIARNLIDSFKYPYTITDAKKWVVLNQGKDDQCKSFTITINDKIAGGIGFSFKKKDKIHTAVIGYWLGENYWGKGYAPEAVNAVTKYAFKHFKIERMEAKVYTWNRPSAKVLEKCGYTFEGTLRKHTIKASKVVDEWIYSIIRSDLKKIK